MAIPAIARTDDDISSCFAVMSELRPHLRADSFLSLVFIEEGGRVVAVAGYRIFTNLFMGKNLYVDDLVTASASRSKGYGEALMRWLRGLAHEAGCTHLHLDSGTQRHRAHRFYLGQRLDITSFHFSQRIAQE